MYEPGESSQSAQALDIDDSNFESDEQLDSGGNSISQVSFQERRREAHSQSEQKRRDSIKRGYEELQELVPTCKSLESGGHKLSKAAVLQKSIEYIQFLALQKRRQEEQRNALRKDAIALRIMHSNYEQMVTAQQALPGADQHHDDDDKFVLFQSIMDQLFLSFESVPVGNFAEFSSGVFNWLEQYCKPEALYGLVQNVLSERNYTYTDMGTAADTTEQYPTQDYFF